MKKIEFGFANDKNPNGSWEGIGIRPGLLITEAEYYGAVKYEDNSYIIAKIVKDDSKRYPDLVGNFMVRPAIADLYKDGSGIIYLDQEQSLIAHQLEKHLNSERIKDRIKSIDDVFRHCLNVHMADNSFTILTVGDQIITTSIKHQVFEEKNEALKNCHKSFSQLQEYYQLSEKENKTR